MRLARSSIPVAALMPAATALSICWHFSTDLAAARAKATDGSTTNNTPCGAIEYQETGTGEPLTARAIRDIDMTPFGYLRTPMSDWPFGVTLLFRSGSDRLLAAAVSGGHATKVGPATVLMLWECRMSNDRTRDSMRVSMSGKAPDLTPQGEKSCFSGAIETLVHEQAG